MICGVHAVYEVLAAGSTPVERIHILRDAKLPRLKQILDLARRLSPADQASLVAQLAPAIAEALEAPAPSAGDDAWRRLDQLREEFRALEPGPISMAEQLDRDRRSRDAALRGESFDVHA